MNETGEQRQEFAETKRKLIEGTEVLRTGGGTSLTATDCNRILAAVASLEARCKELGQEAEGLRRTMEALDADTAAAEARVASLEARCETAEQAHGEVVEWWREAQARVASLEAERDEAEESARSWRATATHNIERVASLEAERDALLAWKAARIEATPTDAEFYGR